MSRQIVHKVIPLSEPEISGHEWKYVRECLDSGWISTAGAFVSRFEKEIAAYVGSPYAVAAVSGTAALHLSLIACGVQPGDEVIVPTLTFVAPVNVVRYCNAYPVFMDCDRDTLCMDVDKVVDFISHECEQKKDGCRYNRGTGRRVKAIIPVHIFGHPVDMDPLIDICSSNHIEIIEDATESLGSTYKGRLTGSMGKAGCLSFNGNKIITTGGGGMVLTCDESFASRVRHLSTQARRESREYDHDEIGFNYRLTSLQAAVGMAQIERLNEFITIKRRNAALYRELLSGIDEVSVLWEKEWAQSNFWLCVLKVPARDKEPLMQDLQSRHIEVRPVWKLIHTLAMYQDCQVFRIENAVQAHSTCVNIPSSVGLTAEDVQIVAKAISSYFHNK